MNKIQITVGVLLVVVALVFAYTLMNFELDVANVPDIDRSADFGTGEYLEDEIIRDSGWAIIPKQEKGERVYWFIAPNEGDISPGVFKKTIHAGGEGTKFTLVGECEASKTTCERLMEEFEQLSQNYD